MMITVAPTHTADHIRDLIHTTLAPVPSFLAHLDYASCAYDDEACVPRSYHNDADREAFGEYVDLMPIAAFVSYRNTLARVLMYRDRRNFIHRCF